MSLRSPICLIVYKIEASQVALNLNRTSQACITTAEALILKVTEEKFNFKATALFQFVLVLFQYVVGILLVLVKRDNFIVSKILMRLNHLSSLQSSTLYYIYIYFVLTFSKEICL